MSDETELLRRELESFRAERERLRSVVHKIGGKDDRPRTRWINGLFLTLMLGLFAVSMLHQLHVLPIPGLPAMVLLETAVLLVSLKLLWMVSLQDRATDFQFWVLNSIDFQISTLSTRLREIEKKLERGGGD